LLAGCDAIFRVDQVGDQAADAIDGPSPDAALPQGLVAWFEMEAVDLGNVKDTAGAHGGICATGHCPTVVTGKVGNGFQFDGTSTVIHALSGGDLDVASDLTVAMWVRVDRAPPSGEFACAFNKLYGTVADNSWQFCSFGDTQSWYLYVSGTQIPGPAIDVGVWQHLAFTWDSTQDQLHEYVNGALFGDYPATSLFDSGGLIIGADTDSGADIWFLGGALDDLRIYKRLLTSTEIANLTH
jgi:hypothetical protein